MRSVTYAAAFLCIAIGKASSLVVIMQGEFVVEMWAATSTSMFLRKGILLSDDDVADATKIFGQAIWLSHHVVYLMQAREKLGKVASLLTLMRTL